jgi:NRPS condensation-like uncharacterized protein
MNKIIFISHKLQTEGPSVMATASLHHTASYCIILHHTVVDGSFELIFQVLKK